jgi:hypothetical protein
MLKILTIGKKWSWTVIFGPTIIGICFGFGQFLAYYLFSLDFFKKIENQFYSLFGGAV